MWADDAGGDLCRRRAGLRAELGQACAWRVGGHLTFFADHPTLAGKTDDQVLDAWIFSVGSSLIDCVWSGGLKVVVGGRHIFKDEIAAQFVKTMRELS